MRLPGIIIPIVLVVFAALTVPLKAVFNSPSAQISVADGAEVDTQNLRRVDMVVTGVKCQGTANYFLSLFNDRDGIVEMSAYAADHRVVITYDPERISIDEMREIAEAPVLGRDGNHYELFKVEKVEDSSR
jgi:hypothetical protein